MSSNLAYDALFIGNYTKDTIISPSGKRYVDGGGMNYASNAAARLGIKAAVVTRLAKEDDRVIQAMMAVGIDCYPTYTPSSTCLTLTYPTENPDIRTLTVTSTAGAITTETIAERTAKAAVISASLRGEVGLGVLRLLRERGMYLAADMQGFARVLREESLEFASWPEIETTLQLVDVVKSDAVEAELLTGETNIRKAARAFAAMGPREIVLTHKDGLLIYADGEFYEFGFYPASLDGRSGRGDTCIGSYVAKRLSADPGEAGMWAAAVTSLKMENPGPFNRPISEVEALIQEKYRA